ncbi:MAG: CvpA family protein [Treponema sp.]|jgi:membrane protein required for colicin V production|nr:CvpA family protein [Treponema sp.]
MNGFAVIDIIFVVLTIIFIVRCALRGFIGELMSMASVVLGLLAAFFFYKNGGVYIREKFMPGMEIIPDILAFIALFLVVFILIKILELMLKEIIEGIKLGGVDRFLGIIFGLVEGVIVVCLILFVITIQPLFDPAPVLNKSIFAEILLPFITGGEYGSGQFGPGSTALPFFMLAGKYV